ncbi:MAG TPA: hypothetical protein VKQ72_05740 [Aggregatilineales bacterium]|nr:hypothetical protein [Aggregatilineales bacterium]
MSVQSAGQTACLSRGEKVLEERWGRAHKIMGDVLTWLAKGKILASADLYEKTLTCGRAPNPTQ